MEIMKDTYQAISKAVNEFVKHEHYELEIKHTDKLKKDSFVNTLKYLMSRGYEKVDLPEVLDVIFMHDGFSYRITISGKENIQSYCLSNKITPEMVSAVVSKRFINDFRPIEVHDFNFKVDMKEEIMINNVKVNELLAVVENALKGFRYKKRYTFNADIFRYDCTIVKKSQNQNGQFLSNRRFSTSSVVSSNETYELEVEMIKRKGNIDDIVKRFIKSGIELYAVVNGIEIVISKNEKMHTIDNYLSLWKEDYDVSQAILKASSFFGGPQPVTLELRNVVRDGLGVNTILSDYTVTEKADGERFLLYVNNEGKCYFINNKLDVFATGAVVDNCKNSLFDGEYITRDYTGKKIKMYALFDAYFLDKKDMRFLPLVTDSITSSSKSSITSRLNAMELFVHYAKVSFKNSGYILYSKKFYFGDDIFKNAKTLMNIIKSNTFVYRIDGMIFTPKLLPVGGLFLNDTPTLNGTWNKVYKWKPPQENTIDMKVKDNGVTVINSEIMKVFDIYVGYKPSQWTPIKPKQYFNKSLVRDTRYTITKFAPPSIVDASINMCYVPMNVDGVCQCKNGDEIYNDSIIEFAYDNTDISKPYPLRWTPLRVRKDKTRPNDYSSAMNVWSSIQSPVTEEIIVGDIPVSINQLPQEEVYYKRNINRDKFASVNMMEFHNYWVKNMFLIGKYGKGMNSLFDIAVGKGGDLKKWLDAGLQHVYGVDKVRDNIENPMDGIYSRLLNNASELTGERAEHFVFGTMDSSKIIDSQYIATLSTDDDKFIGEKLLAHDPFDIVSCQFAIHYFFETEKTLDNFLWNVDTFLKPGGYFIGTCLDGKSVVEFLKNTKYGESVNGRENDRLLWSIKKLYRDGEHDGFGQQIKIFMESIGIELTEYLVNMSVLIEKLKEYDIHPVNIMPFGVVYNMAISMKGNPDVNQYYMEKIEKMKDIEKMYSFLNTIFVFQKGGVVQNDNIVKKRVAKKIVKISKEEPLPVVETHKPLKKVKASKVDVPKVDAEAAEAPKKKIVVKKQSEVVTEVVKPIKKIIVKKA